MVLFLSSDIKTPNVKNISDSTCINNNSYYKQLINISTKIDHHNTRKQNNKLQHIKNGNYHLNVLHWNKGNTLFKNKITQIDQIMDKYRPHIISLCEANIEKTINNTPNDTYKDYKIEHTKMSSTTNNSRNAILIKK